MAAATRTARPGVNAGRVLAAAPLTAYFVLLFRVTVTDCPPDSVMTNVLPDREAIVPVYRTAAAANAAVSNSTLRTVLVPLTDEPRTATLFPVFKPASAAAWLRAVWVVVAAR